MSIKFVINLSNETIYTFMDSEFTSFLDHTPIIFPEFHLPVHKSIKNMKENHFIFYEKGNFTIPVPISDGDFENYLQERINLKQLRKKYIKERVSSKDDYIPSRSISEETEKKLIRTDTENPVLIVDGKELKDDEKRVLGKGAYGEVSYENGLIKKTQKDFDASLVEIIAIKENPSMAQYEYRIDLKDKNKYVITSKISGERSFDKFPIPKNLNSRKIARICLDLLLQLRYLHSLGIYHRDIKRENTLISKQDDHYITHFIDFGISYIDVGQDDKNKHAKSAYCPESYNPNLENLPRYIDKSDICALGIMIFAYINGRHIEIWRLGNVNVDKANAEYIQNPTQENKQKQLLAIKNNKIDYYTLDEFSKESFRNHLISKSKELIPDGLTSLLYHMCHAVPENRWDIDKLINHPYLSSNIFDDYFPKNFPFIVYSQRDSPNISKFNADNTKFLIDKMKGVRIPLLTQETTNHTVNLIFRVLNSTFIDDQNLVSKFSVLVDACFVISYGRLIDTFKVSGEQIFKKLIQESGKGESYRQDIINMTFDIINNVDCRCGIKP